MSSAAEAIATAQSVMRRAADGDLEARVAETEKHGEYAPFLVALNQLLDQADSFVREATASAQAASAGRFHRSFLERGMRGAFRRGAAVINDSRARMLEAVRQDEHARYEREQRERERRSTALRETMHDFETVIGLTMDRLAESSRHMTDATDQIAKAASLSTSENEAASAATQEAASRLDDVSRAGNALSGSIGEIRSQVDLAQRKADQAAVQGRSAEDRIKALDATARDIGKVVDLINRIAGQTNLLALNATIEAARAGEMGKGFAVVASEVKALARQTGDATKDISTRVDAIQSSVKEAVVVIAGIARELGELHDAAAAVAGAVDRQAGAASDISRSVAHAVDNVGQVTGNAAQALDAARGTADAATKVRQTSGEVSGAIEQIKSEVVTFLSAVQRAGERRGFERRPVDFKAEIEVIGEGRRRSGRIKNLSVTGALFEPSLGITPGLSMQLHVEGQVFAGRVVRDSGQGLHLQFQMGSAQMDAVEALMPFDR